MTPGAPPSFQDLFDLSGRVALITGAASGFGETISLAFAEYGCDIAVADLNLPGAEATAAKVCAKGRRATAVSVDIAVPEQIQAMVQATVDAFGTIDVLVNCAGVSPHEPAESASIGAWDECIDVNLRGTFLCCQAAARVMLEKGRGVMINFSSIAGSVGFPRGVSAYCASKGGVNTLTRQLAIEWGSRGIRVNAIAPCQFMTAGLEAVMRDPQFDPVKLMQTWTANIPLGRIGQAHEIAGPAVFLASDASSMVTGTILDVDGGYLAR